MLPGNLTMKDNSGSGLSNNCNSNYRGQKSNRKTKHVPGNGENVELEVITVDYYSRNEKFAISTDKPPFLNPLGHLFLNQSISQVNIPLENLDCTDGPVENNMESLLNYIKSHPQVLDDVEFVTYRQILASAAANRDTLHIQAIRCHGRIWIRKLADGVTDLPGSQNCCNMARATAFERLLVDDKDESKFPRRNGLFKAAGVLYSGELDAVDCDGRNVEIKSTLKDDRLRRRGAYYYWQCHLGNVVRTLVGRIDNQPGVDTVRTISSYTADGLMEKIKAPQGFARFAVENGGRRIGKMLDTLRRHLKDDGDSVVMTRQTYGFAEDSWTVAVELASEDFQKKVENLFNFSEE